ncbi:hypothetical protein G3I59_14025 [Amycolatopsis rubida]|uniref:Phthiocerol/phthiodiolone dimycocerosyl transferase n=1 Tax=Amycolatopsis rubida TaxID=112413 RepID=A0ABX0BSL3_9PSEU|nr:MULTISPECIES: hypothetical protein [Amycolatopsis]MYW91689.1 hypothetical protein [Amycolatopsis rubida]NEC56673.1 hypothetical protein [Amycolatopsis rubida]OAP20436.1 Phthiocerol/phthiodiolone dimycocerosyl transferase [Amycolatopsis sp. M39]
MTLRRYLDHIEVRSVNNCPSYVAECEGVIDPELLSRAFDLLCARNPVLLGRIRADGAGHLLSAEQGRRLELVVRQGGKPELLEEIHRPWDSADQVARPVLVRGARSSFVAIRLDHAIADGSFRMGLFTDLWRLYGALAAGRRPDVEPRAVLPRSPVAVLAERLADLDFPAPAGRSVPPVFRYRLLEKRLRLTVAETQRLVTAAKALGTSVHALICGAVMVAHRDLWTGSSEIPMMCWAPVNLRTRATPPIGDTETTNLTLIHEAVVKMARQADPVVVGREIKAHLADAIENGELPTGPPTWVESALEEHYSTVLISNYGVMPPFSPPPGARIVDFETLSHPMIGRYPSYPVYTYGGELTILARYQREFYREDLAAELLGRISDTLRELGRTAVPARVGE